MRFLILVLVTLFILSGCGSSRTTTTVVQPRTYKVWPKGNKYRINIRVGARRIQLFERKRTKKVRMR